MTRKTAKAQTEDFTQNQHMTRKRWEQVHAAQCRSPLLCPSYMPSAAVPCCVHPIVPPRAKCPVPKFLAMFTQHTQCRSSLLCPPYCTAPCPVLKFLAVSTLLYCPVPSAEVPCCVHPVVLPRAQCRSSLLWLPSMPSVEIPCCVHPTCPVPQSLAVSTIHAQC